MTNGLQSILTFFSLPLFLKAKTDVKRKQKPSKNSQNISKEEEINKTIKLSNLILFTPNLTTTKICQTTSHNKTDYKLNPNLTHEKPRL